MNYDLSNINQFKPPFPDLCLKSFITNQLRLKLFFIFLWLFAYITVILADRPKISYTINYPERFIHPKSKLEIEFNRFVLDYYLTSSEISNHIEINPSIEGTWSKPSSDKLIFNPAKDWEPGKKFKVVLHHSLFRPELNMGKFELAFESPQFEIKVIKSEFTQSQNRSIDKTAFFEVVSTYPLNKTDFERKIKLQLESLEHSKKTEEIPFVISYSSSNRHAFIRSSTLKILEHRQKIRLTIPRKIYSQDNSAHTQVSTESEVLVPRVSDLFKVEGVYASTLEDPNTYIKTPSLVIEFSSPVTIENLQRKVKAVILPDDHEILRNLRLKLQKSLKEQDEEEEGLLDDGSYESEDSYYEDNYSRYKNIDRCPLESVAQVTKDLLSQSVPLKLKWEKVENKKDLKFVARIDAPSGSCIFVEINRNLQNIDGFELSKDFKSVLSAPPIPADIYFPSKGAILTLSGEKKLPVVVRNISRLKVKLWRVLPSGLHFLASKSRKNDESNIINLISGIKPEDLGEYFEKVIQVPNADPAMQNLVEVNLSEYIAPNKSYLRGLFLLKLEGFSSNSEDPIVVSPGRLVHLSDLGFIVKTLLDGSLEVFVSSISQERPISKAEVSVLAQNGLPIFSVQTDELGHAKIPPIPLNIPDKKLTMIKVQTKDDLSFIINERWDRTIQFSGLDASGQLEDIDDDSLTGFIFSDRDLYRPGEEAKFGIMIKTKSWKELTGEFPVEVRVKNPRKKLISRQLVTVPREGFLDYSFKFDEYALVGQYDIQISVPGSQAAFANKTIFIKDFKPDLLRLQATFVDTSTNAAPSGSWLSPKNLAVKVRVENLFGTPAQGHTVKVVARLSPLNFSNTKYPNFKFATLVNADNSSSIEKELSEVVTDSNGEAFIPVNLQDLNFPAFLEVLVEAFEKHSGRSVVKSLTSNISPFDFVVGFKALQNLELSSTLDSNANTLGFTRFLSLGEKASLKALALDKTLEPVSVDDLELKIFYRIKKLSLVESRSGALEYQSYDQTKLVSSETFKISKDGALISLPTDKIGDFLVELRAKNQGTLAELSYRVVGKGQPRLDLNKSEQLKVQLNKKLYQPGEEVEILIESPFLGHGLITIERDKIYAFKWFSLKNLRAVERISIPSNLLGDGYINVAVVKSLESPEIYLKPFAAAIAYFKVEEFRHRLLVQLNTPKQITPGSSLKIHVATAEKAKTVVFAVDEGILNVARYRDPDPLNYFFGKKALQVVSKQNFDLLIPEFSLVQRLFATGGGEDLESALGKHQNPFKRKGEPAVAFWSGIIETDPNSREVIFQVPDSFNGSLKVFAVATAPGKAGFAASSVVSQGDLVVAPHFPYFLSPGDEPEISLKISNIKSSSSSFKVTLNTDEKLELLDDGTKAVEVKQGEEKVVYFKIRALDKLGSSRLNFEVSDKSLVVKTEPELSIRPRSTFKTTVTIGSLEPQKSIFGSSVQKITPSRNVYSENEELLLAVRASPLAWALGLKKFLNNYPFGCSEQITSALIPRVIFVNQEILGVDAKRMREEINKGIQILFTRQNNDGSFNLWEPGDASEGFSPELDVHIGWLLFEAKIRNLPVPQELWRRTVRRLKTIAKKPIRNLAEARSSAQGVYILARANEDMLATFYNDLLENLNRSSLPWKTDLTGLIVASTAEVLGDQDLASSLLQEVQFDKDSIFKSIHKSPYYYNFRNPLSDQALLVSLTAKHFFSKLSKHTSNIINSIEKLVSGNLYSTFSAAYIIEAAASYEAAVNAKGMEGVQVRAGPSEQSLESLDIKSSTSGIVSLKFGTRVIEITNRSNFPVFYSLTQSGYDRNTDNQASSGIELLKSINKTTLKLGDEIRVDLQIRLLSNDLLYEPLVLVDLIPGGFEVIEDESSFEDLSPDFVQILEDRVVLFLTPDRLTTSVSYKLQATSKGKFLVPTAFAELMYKQNYSGSSGSSVVVVE